MRLFPIPEKILVLVLVTCVLFLATLFGTLDWVRKRMDLRAQEDSIRLVASQIATDSQGLANMAQDYSNWKLAYDSVARRDLPWLADNFGVTAVAGIAFDRLAVFDGPLPNLLTWGRDGPMQPSVGYVPREVLDAVRGLLDQHSVEFTYTVNFFAMIDGSPTGFSGTYILPGADGVLSELRREDLSIAVFGRTITDERRIALGQNLNLRDLAVSQLPPTDRPYHILTAADGSAAAYLSWQAPKPGSELFYSLLPLLLLISGAFIAVSLTVAIIARKNARRLVDQEAAASRAARTDPLTGLPNRLAFNEHIDTRELPAAFGLAILFIDVNGFKRINDTIGHAGGDAIVSELSKRLLTLADSSRFFARVGGDEFVYVITDPVNVTALAQQTATAVSALFKADFDAGGQRFTVSAAQGLAIKDKAFLDVGELVRRADTAMYHAKRMSATEAQLYDEAIETISREDRTIEKALRHGIENPHEFTMHYQPIVDANTAGLVRAEALARWRSGSLGSIGPDRFIRVAEAAGLIPELGRVLLGRVCDDLVACPDLSVSINISPIQLQSSQFVADLSRALQSRDIAPHRIEIELTEGVIIDNPELAAFRLALLHDEGFTTALDDFGTGFSSIGYLRNLPFGTLKIDRSFVDEGSISPRNCELIRSIIHLGHSFGQIVVCEGIETEEQARQLRAMGCDLFQGYLFGRPMPLTEFTQKYPALARPMAA